MDPFTVLKNAFGRGPFPHQLAFLLDNPVRRWLLSPEVLADRLHLAPDARVLEIGCGNGYFSVEVARRVPAGRLQLLDLQPQMLEKAKRKLQRAGITNVACTTASAEQLPFDAGSFDVALLVTVLGEVPDQRACLRDARRVLRHGGLLSITEQRPDPDFLPADQLRPLVEREGFAFAEQFGRPWNYTANFVSKASSPSPPD